MRDLDTEFWARLIGKSTQNAMASLSTMIGQEVAVDKLRLRPVSMADIAEMMGGPEALTVGIYLTVSGSADGHMMLMYQPAIAFGFVDLLLGQEIGMTSALGEMEESALGEMGNVVGSSFLNAMADSAALRLMPSPPSVTMDMAGALLDIIAVDIMLNQDEAYIAETTFRTPGQAMSGVFFVIPGDSLMQALEQGAGAAT